MRAPLLTLSLLASCAPRTPDAPSAAGPESPPAPTVTLAGYRAASAADLAALGWSADARGELCTDVLVGGPERDAWVPIAEPRHAAARDVELDPSEPVLVLRGEREVAAWPLVHLLWRELALDAFEGAPIAVTYCSLCNSARVFDRRLDGQTLELRVSGLLSGGNSLLYDVETMSLWRQLTGEAVAGAHAGRRLAALPAFTVSFGQLARAHPDARVMLAPDPGGTPSLELVSAEHVARGSAPPWLFAPGARPLDPALWIDASGAVELSRATRSGEPLALDAAGAVCLFDPATAPVHRTADGGRGPELGSSAAFRAQVDGRALRFVAASDPGSFRDRETDSRWNALGEAVEGELAGARLEPLPQAQAFRFAVRAAGGNE